MKILLVYTRNKALRLYSDCEGILELTKTTEYEYGNTESMKQHLSEKTFAEIRKFWKMAYDDRKQ